VPVEIVEVVCDTCGKESHVSEDRPITAFHCNEDNCKGTMWRLDKAGGIEKVTSLSRREAELYVFKQIQGMTLKEAAEEMGIEENTAKGKWGRIKKKIRESEATTHLSP